MGRRCPQGSAPPPRGALRQERGQRAHRHRGGSPELRRGGCKRRHGRGARNAGRRGPALPVPGQAWGPHPLLDAAEEAFGQPLGRELQALLLIAFHKIKIRRERQEAMAQAKAKANPKPRPKRLASPQPTLSEVD